MGFNMNRSPSIVWVTGDLNIISCFHEHCSDHCRTEHCLMLSRLEARRIKKQSDKVTPARQIIFDHLLCNALDCICRRSDQFHSVVLVLALPACTCCTAGIDVCLLATGESQSQKKNMAVVWLAGSLMENTKFEREEF